MENKDYKGNKTIQQKNTPEWLRSFKGCGHYSDAEAIDILSGLDTLAAIFLKTAEIKSYTIDNQLSVSLDSQHKTKKIAA